LVEKRPKEGNIEGCVLQGYVRNETERERQDCPGRRLLSGDLGHLGSVKEYLEIFIIWK